MIRSFRDKETRDIFETGKSRRFRNVLDVVIRKLTMLHAAVGLNDLRAPPANRLERLVGNRAGQHSIRVNDQLRLCCRWTAQGPEDVELVDYH
ncbi:type II toxin-antitoxin system RelE/ParE family toxin [soil metagenome]